MILNKKVWDSIFKEKKKYFEKPHKDFPEFVKLLKTNNTRRILDLGCGSGRHTVYLTQKGYEVYGTDISETALSITNKWLKSKNLTAELAVHDIAKKLPFKDNYFDAVVSVQVIHHARIGTIKKIIREIKRVLRAGGLVFITVPIYKGPITGVKKHSWTMKRIANRTYVPLDGLEKGLPHYFFKEDEFESEFKRVGFKILKAYFDNTNHFCLIGKTGSIRANGLK